MGVTLFGVGGLSRVRVVWVRGVVGLAGVVWMCLTRVTFFGVALSRVGDWQEAGW